MKTNTPKEVRAAPGLDARLEAALTRKRTARFQLWQALLAALLGVAVLIGFAAVALYGEEKGAGPIAKAVHAVAAAPATAHKVTAEAIAHYHPRLAKTQRFEGEAGFSIAPGAPRTGDLIALSRFDGDAKRGEIDIVSMDDGAVLWAYRPDLEGIYARAKIPERVSHLRRDHSPSRYLPYAPSVEADGSMVFHSMDSPLVKEDACSRILWMIDGEFHHGVESDGAGGNWAIRTLSPPTVERVGPDYQDDAVAHVSSDGKILFERSISQALIGSGYDYIVYSHDAYDPDPIHLNDVQPALSDTAYWKAGDLFLSIRNASMLALYRPSTDEIVWAKSGPWLMQHDVDIISDHEIAVLNNNAAAVPSGEWVRGVNSIVVYDFADGKTRTIFEDSFKKADVRSKTNGLFAMLPDGAMMVEEQNYGRLLAFSPDGSVRWTFINRAPKDGRVYQLGWSRALTGARATEIRNALAHTSCPA